MSRFLVEDEITSILGEMSAVDARYVHTQLAPAAQWDIAHGLGKRPVVAVVDSAGSVVVGNVQHVDANHVRLTFAAPFAGVAYLN